MTRLRRGARPALLLCGALAGVVTAGTARAQAAPVGVLTLAVAPRTIEPLDDASGAATATVVKAVLPAPRGGFTVVWDQDTAGKDLVGLRTFGPSGDVVATDVRDFGAPSGGPAHVVRGALPPAGGSGAVRLVAQRTQALGPSPDAAVDTRYVVASGALDPAPTGSARSIYPPLRQARDLSVAAVELPNGDVLAVTTGGEDAIAPPGDPEHPTQPDLPDAAYVTTLVPDGSNGPFQPISTAVGPAMRQAAVTAFTDSTALAVWSQDLAPGGGGGSSIVAEHWAGRPGDVVVVNQSSVGAHDSPSVTTLADGDAVVVWRDGAGTGPGGFASVRGRVVGAGGGFATGEFPIGPTAVGGQSDPHVAPLLGGGFVVVWRDSVPSYSRLVARTFDADGVATSPELVIADGDSTVQARPLPPMQAATLSDGRVAVAWSTASAPTDAAVGHVTVLDPHPELVLGDQVPFSGRPGQTAVVSIVSTDTVGGGYVQLLPCGSTPGVTSNVNTDATGQTRAGTATVRFDGMGRACVYRHGVSQVVVDVQGYFTPAAYDDVTDYRMLDTRVGPRPPAGATQVVFGRPDSTGVISVVATDSTGAGYVQVVPCGQAPGSASNLNLDAAGQTRAALAFARFAADGTACIYAQPSTHVVVDLQGYLAFWAFEDTPDVRILDTRVTGTPTAGTQTPLVSRPDSTAVVAITATGTGAPGYLQLLPCGAMPGGSSNLNVDAPGQTIANLAVATFALPALCVYQQPRTDVVVDVQGFLSPLAWVDTTDRRVLDTRLDHPQTAA